VLEEDLESTTFVRHVRYSLKPSNGGISLRVDDDVRFKGLGKLAAAIATRDIKFRWHSSLEKLKATAEGRESACSTTPPANRFKRHSSSPNATTHAATPGTAPRHQRACLQLARRPARPITDSIRPGRPIHTSLLDIGGSSTTTGRRSWVIPAPSGNAHTGRLGTIPLLPSRSPGLDYRGTRPPVKQLRHRATRVARPK
jgi:hypothetical protein